MMDFMTHFPRTSRRHDEGVGDSGPAHQVGTFSGSTDYLHTRGILQVIHTRDCPVTWSTSVHSIGQGSHIHDKLLEEFPKYHGDAIDDEHCVSPTDGWSIGEDHTDFRGHVASMRPRS